MIKSYKLNQAFVLAALLFGLGACDKEEKEPEPAKVTLPVSYKFERAGSSTVNFSGQTERIKMATELNGALRVSATTEATLLEMFRNQTASGGDANPFGDAALNSSSKNIKGKVAASKDYFSANASESNQLKGYIENWVSAQAKEVFPNWEALAKAGQAGQVPGSQIRYVSAQGYEYNQLVAKGLIGSLMLDQIANNYLSTAILDESTNKADNDAGKFVEGTNYTKMEHSWDEAYGYLFGNSATPDNPLASDKADDSFLNNYLRTVNKDTDFAGITQKVLDAFKLGRAAIVAKNYKVRDEQAEIIRDNLSKVVGIRAIFYLNEGKKKIEEGKRAESFHDLSEAVGFVYSLRFTRKPGTTSPYLPSEEIGAFMQEAFKGNGLWDIKPETLDKMATRIASASGIDKKLVIN